MTEHEFWKLAGITWALIGAGYAATWLALGVRFVNRRKAWKIWAAGALAFTSVVYVLSSGPMLIVGFQSEISTAPATLPDGTVVVATSETGPGEWFAIAYAPLIWAGEHSFGEPIYWYWELFQNTESEELP